MSICGRDSGGEWLEVYVDWTQDEAFPLRKFEVASSQFCSLAAGTMTVNCFVPYQPCRSQVLDGHAYGLEQDAAGLWNRRHVGVGENLSDFGLDGGFRADHVASLAGDAIARLGDQPGGMHHVIVEFALGDADAAHRKNQCIGLERAAPENRRGR